MISAIEATVGQSAILNFEPAQPGDVSANVLDITKIHSATGWTPATNLADGLAQTWDWMKPKLFRRPNGG
jgi:nucleoside-diphosphate-sugar epimerase